MLQNTRVRINVPPTSNLQNAILTFFGNICGSLLNKSVYSKYHFFKNLYQFSKSFGICGCSNFLVLRRNEPQCFNLACISSKIIEKLFEECLTVKLHLFILTT
eukprot:UN14775